MSRKPSKNSKTSQLELLLKLSALQSTLRLAEARLHALDSLPSKVLQSLCQSMTIADLDGLIGHLWKQSAQCGKSYVMFANERDRLRSSRMASTILPFFRDRTESEFEEPSTIPCSSTTLYSPKCSKD